MATYEKQWRTRHHEADRDGFTAVTAVLRYCEEIRWYMVMERVFDTHELFQGGYPVVRSQQVELGERLVGDTQILVELEVGRVGRSSVELIHRVVRVDDSAVAARLALTWVQVGPDGRSAPISDAVRDHTTADEPLQMCPAADSRPPDGAWSGPVRLRPEDIDPLQHVNHSNYFALAERVVAAAAADGAYPRPTAGAVERFRIDYDRELTLDADISATTWADTDTSVVVALSRDGGQGARARLVLRPDRPRSPLVIR